MYFLRIFLSIIITAGLGFGGYAYWLMDEIKRQHNISTENVYNSIEEKKVLISEVVITLSL